jgi:hypothetical protein
MLTPGTKVECIVFPFEGKFGVVIDPDEPTTFEKATADEPLATIVVRVNEHPDWEDWEPAEDNDYWFKEEELRVIPGAEEEGPSDDEAGVQAIHVEGGGDTRPTRDAVPDLDEHPA